MDKQFKAALEQEMAKRYKSEQDIQKNINVLEACRRNGFLNGAIWALEWFNSHGKWLPWDWEGMGK